MSAGPAASLPKSACLSVLPSTMEIMIAFQDSQITVFQSALFQTTSAVVEGAGFVLVVDPTWLPQEVEDIAEFVRSIRAGRAVYLLFTHSDFDHLLGYGAFPDAITIASRAFQESTRKERSVQTVRTWDSEYYVQRPYAVSYPEISVAAAGDGQELVLGETRFTFYAAPGHNPDGLWTVIEPHGILIAGDYLSDIEFPYIYHSSTAYEETLRKLDGILERHSIHILVPGHGQVTTDRREMKARQQRSFDYITALRRYLTSGDQAAIDAMLADCAFPLGMASFHAGNQTLMRKELTILHICSRRDWEIARQAGEYTAASLASEGFIHCSTPGQVVKTANRFYRGQTDLVLLIIDAGRVTAEIKYEAADTDLFPHIYGPINLDAVVGAREFAPDADGTFQQPDFAD